MGANFDEASRTRSSPKPSCSRVVKIIDQTQVTRPRGESRSTSTLIITHFRVPKRVKMASRQVFDEKGSPVKLFSQVCMGELNEGG